MTIGITGGICCGKSSLAEGLHQHGWAIIDTDEVAHTVLEDNVAKAEIIKAFGTSILNEDGTINRKTLGKIVFADPAELEKLNQIMLPKVRFAWETIRQHHLATRSEQPLAVLVPLLFEKNLENLFDQVWCVGISRELQVKRLQEFRHYSLKEANERINSQMPILEKMKRSQITFWNEGSKEELWTQLEIVLNSL